jgi:hypothetical protein
MSDRKSRTRFIKTSTSTNGAKKNLSPGALTETSWLAFLRIIGAAVLFTVLALWSLAKFQRFGENHFLKNEIAGFRSAINKAQVFAVQKRQTVRLNLSEIEKNHVYGFEKLARGRQYYRSAPNSKEEHAYGLNPLNWSPVEPAQRQILSLIDVEVGSLTTLYMFPDGTCSNSWPKPYLLYGATKMKSEVLSFSLGEASISVFFTDTGLMPANDMQK